MIYVWERLTKLLDRHHASLLSWSIVHGAHRPGATATQHSSTLAAYRLLDALRERYPQLTIQTTSLDLAMAARAVGAELSGTRRRGTATSLVWCSCCRRDWYGSRHWTSPMTALQRRIARYPHFSATGSRY